MNTLSERQEKRAFSSTISVLLMVDQPSFESRHKELKALVSSDDSEGDAQTDFAADFVTVSLDESCRLRIRLLSKITDAIALIRATPIHLILLDNRGSDRNAGFAETLAGRMLPELLGRTALGPTSVRGNVFLICAQSPATPYHTYAAGTLQIGGVVVAPQSIRAALESAWRVVRLPQPGKTAICLAGGGIEGMFYELGVLRALDAHLAGGSVIDFDIFTGISSGSVVSAFLANGVRPEEMIDALKGRPSPIDPVTRGMLFDPNISEIFNRLLGALGDVVRGEWLRQPLDAALKVAPTAIFSGSRLRRYMEQQLAKPGLTDHFERLESQLFIGATDQDKGTHVTFGEEGLQYVPISHAVRASTAMTPYYPPEKIDGRYYIDGIFSRTMNLDVAVAHGAKLIVCINPLIPVDAVKPGYVSGRGGVFNTIQSIKSMIGTRFTELIGRTEEVFPDVTVVVFSPSTRDMEHMSGTLMRFFYRTETVEMAFDSASRQLKKDYPWLNADFGNHGFELLSHPKSGHHF